MPKVRKLGTASKQKVIVKLMKKIERFVMNMSIAKIYGTDKAIFINHVAYWMKKNAKADRNIRDGKVWTYNTVREYEELFPCWKRSKISNMITQLIKGGVLEKGCYNRFRYDRTGWYTIIDPQILQLYGLDSQETGQEDSPF